MGVRVLVVGNVALIYRVTRTGMPYRLSRVLVSPDEPVGSLAAIEREVEIMLKKADLPKVEDGGPAPVQDKQLLAKCPTLHAYLTQQKWEDGSPRQTASLLIFTDGGIVKAMLRDPNAGHCLWVATPTVWDVFGVVEAALLDPRADWRIDRRAPGQQAKRVRKTS